MYKCKFNFNATSKLTKALQRCLFENRKNIFYSEKGFLSSMSSHYFAKRDFVLIFHSKSLYYSINYEISAYNIWESYENFSLYHFLQMLQCKYKKKSLFHNCFAEVVLKIFNLHYILKLKKVVCLPIYWKSLESEILEMDICKSSDELRKLQIMISSQRKK